MNKTLELYSIPPGVPTNDRFSVRVRMSGGPWQDLACYRVMVDLHNPRPVSMAYFDFAGSVEVAVTLNDGELRAARVRPLSYRIVAAIDGNTLTFTLDRPRNLSIEVNGDLFGSLHLFAGPIETERSRPDDPHVMYFGPGLHDRGERIEVPSDTTVYLAGGAVLKSMLCCNRVKNVRILGRGVLLNPQRGFEVNFSKDVTIDGLTVINPVHYTVHGGQSRRLTIRNLKSFSADKWSDGIDLMSCAEVLIDGVFLRTSDDCIAIYCHRWDFSGDARNITLQNSTLWADVAHPVNMGTHGNPARPETIEQITIRNIDILNHHEPQVGCQGCIAINVSDENLVRDVRVEDVRIEDFEQGQLFNLRVVFNGRYSEAPGRGIEQVYFKNVVYSGQNAEISFIAGYDTSRAIRKVVFENLTINGRVISDDMKGKPKHFATGDMARIFVGEHVTGVRFDRSGSADE